MEVENSENKYTIDSKYIITEKKGHGATANVYLVKLANSDEVYAAKVLKNRSKLFEKEVLILNHLKETHNPFMVNIIDSGEGVILKKNKPSSKKQYVILEYASKGELFNYIYYPGKSFSERHCKVIFAKILKGIQSIHKAGICHRDLKSQNILLDDNFNPKICDFGFAEFNSNNLKDPYGTDNYAPPEIYLKLPYDGTKVDIFSLGVVLLTLTTCRIGFKKATINDPYYSLILSNRFESYWKRIGQGSNGISDDLKELYLQMISFNPDKRPSIDDILNSKWMKEIRDMNDAQLSQLENEIKNEFLQREPLVEKGLKKEMEINKKKQKNYSGNKSASDDVDNIFALDLKPKFAQTGLNMDNYIKLKGEINPAQLMNLLTSKINKAYDCFIKPSPNKFKCIISFENENDEEISEEVLEELKKLGYEIKEEEEDDEENEQIKKNQTNIQIKLYESYNGGYILRFVKKGGELGDYYDKMEKITSFVQEIISD